MTVPKSVAAKLLAHLANKGREVDHILVEDWSRQLDNAVTYETGRAAIDAHYGQPTAPDKPIPWLEPGHINAAAARVRLEAAKALERTERHCPWARLCKCQHRRCAGGWVDDTDPVEPCQLCHEARLAVAAETGKPLKGRHRLPALDRDPKPISEPVRDWQLVAAGDYHERRVA